MKDDKYQLKIRAVLLRESGKSIRSITRELGISRDALILWFAIYKAKGERGLHESYNPQRSSSEKLCVLEDLLNNNLSLPEASSKYLVSIESIRNWLKAYQSYGSKGLVRKNEAGNAMSKKKREYTREELDELTDLRRRNEWLEAENAMLKKAKALVEARRAQQRANGQESSKN